MYLCGSWRGSASYWVSPDRLLAAFIQTKELIHNLWKEKERGYYENACIEYYNCSDARSGRGSNSDQNDSYENNACLQKVASLIEAMLQLPKAKQPKN